MEYRDLTTLFSQSGILVRVAKCLFCDILISGFSYKVIFHEEAFQRSLQSVSFVISESADLAKMSFDVYVIIT